MAVLELVSCNSCKTVGRPPHRLSSKRGGAACRRWRDGKKMYVRKEGVRVLKRGKVTECREREGAGEVNVSRWGNRNRKTTDMDPDEEMMSK